MRVGKTEPGLTIKSSTAREVMQESLAEAGFFERKLDVSLEVAKEVQAKSELCAVSSGELNDCLQLPHPYRKWQPVTECSLFILTI
jgi:hypothetical protein